MAAPRRKTRQTGAQFGAAPDSMQRRRLLFLRLVFLCVFSAIFWRLAVLQLGPNEDFSQNDLAHIGSAPIKQPRGNIYDRHGQMLATDGEQPALCADPKQIDDPERLASEISQRLGLPYDATLARLRRDTRFVYIAKDLAPVDLETLGDVKAWSGGGLWLNAEPARTYAQENMAAQVLGFVNKEHIGGAGLEAQFDAFLRSTPGKHTANKDARGVLVASSKEDYVAPEGGGDMRLTLDTVIQHSLEDAIDRRLEEVDATRGMGIVMDPDTGAILALATRPAFDPNRFWEYPPESWKNNAITDVFEPGSVFKIVAAAAALEHGLITPETEIDCENGQYYIGRRRIRDVHKLDIEPFSMCFAESSNIAIVKVADMLGPQRFHDWIRAFGFGERACPDLPQESVGIFRPLDKWSGYSMGSLPMGQEISVTMTQLARAFSIIANGGMMVQPHVVESIVDQEGHVVYAHEPGPEKRVISEETARTMQALCHMVVTQGTGSKASIDSYRVGGKTGTAQVARKDGRGYEEDKYTAVFAGFAPVNDPKLVSVIVVQEPHIRLHYGGHVCGPIFKEVVQTSLRYMHVPRDPVVGTIVAREDEIEADAAHLDDELLEAFLDDDDWMASVEALEPLPPAEDAAWGPGMPSVLGMSRVEAMEELARQGLRWDMQGSGWVAEQDPRPGASLDGVEVCRLVLRAKESSRYAAASP